MDVAELQACGLCGLTPEQFGALTVPEFLTCVEAAMWREARQHRVLSTAVAHLLSPHLKEGHSVGGLVEDLTGGDPDRRIVAERQRRLAALRRKKEEK